MINPEHKAIIFFKKVIVIIMVLSAPFVLAIWTMFIFHASTNVYDDVVKDGMSSFWASSIRHAVVLLIGIIVPAVSIVGFKIYANEFDKYLAHVDDLTDNLEFRIKMLEDENGILNEWRIECMRNTKSASTAEMYAVKCLISSICSKLEIDTNIDRE